MRSLSRETLALLAVLLGSMLLLHPAVLPAQTSPESPQQTGKVSQGNTAEDYNRRIQQLRQAYENQGPGSQADEYRIGANDLLDINVFEAPELNRSLRVSAGGEISMPLLGGIQCIGLTAQELEVVLEQRLREFMKDPHVGVFISAMESHAVSVVGAVKKAGVFQVRGPKSVLEMLSMAEGLDDDAGEEVLVMRAAGLHAEPGAQNATLEAASPGTSPASDDVKAPIAAATRNNSSDAETVRIKLKDLLESGDPRFNVTVYPGDIVKVTQAGIVYVVGDVKKPGGFVLKNDRQISVLKAIALAEGLTATSAKSRTKIIRTNGNTGERVEIPIDLGKVLAGKTPDPPLNPADIVFVPSSSGKSVFYKGTAAAITTASGLIIFR
jgi:polysaccharide export outer membrane protein